MRNTRFSAKNLQILEIVLKFATMKRPLIVQKISDSVHRNAPTATTILYGSEARGDARPDSDIDVLILLDGEKMDWKKNEDIVGALYQIEWETGVSINPMLVLKKNWDNRPFKTPFYVNVMNEGVKI